MPKGDNPFNPEARPTDLIPGYLNQPGGEHPGLEPGEEAEPQPLGFAGSVDPHPMAPIQSSAAITAEPIPAGDPDPAPGLPVWSELGQPVTPGTGPHNPPPNEPPTTSHELPVPVATTAASGAGQLVEEEDGLGLLAGPGIVAGSDLPANARLLRLLISDNDLRTVWREIAQLEKVITSHSQVSLEIARELLDRLRRARNVILNNVANYEEAERDIAEVRFRLARWQRLQFYELPRFLAIYLVVWLLAVPLMAWIPLLMPTTFSAVEFQAQALEPMAGLNIAVLWWTLSAGLAGGVLGALFNLFRHASQRKDYDPDHAYWFLLAPVVGMVLSVGVFLVGRSGLIFGRQDFDWSIYALSFLLGFQQNLALRYFYRIVRRILPPDDSPTGQTT